jgi:Acetyltransferase (GNAT) domain
VRLRALKHQFVTRCWLSGTSYGFADTDDHLVASGLTVEFAHFGWISMILVTAPYRRHGLAIQLMGRCVDALASRRLVPALDASPDGREVYRRLGFRDVGNSTRLVGTLASEAKNAASDIFELTSSRNFGTNIFVNRNGHWLMVFHQAAEIPRKS